MGGERMPAISMFYGIIISMYFFDIKKHKLPHIHTKYQGQDFCPDTLYIESKRL
jgi:hypothetical protein